MPYLEAAKDGQKEEDIKQVVEVPNLIGISINEASRILKEINLEMVINNNQEDLDKENTTITGQTPLNGIKVYEGSNIYIDY